MQLPLAGLHDLGTVDYCVIGAGPAGITCALKLASARSRVLLIEAGGEEISAESQQIYEGNVTGDDYFPLDVTRLRFLGGASNHWSGWCRPLDRIDFEGKGPSRLGRWPIEKSDLDPFLVEACEILEINPNFSEFPLSPDLKQITFAFSPPVNFRQKYLQQIMRNQSLLLCLNANMVQIETDGREVRSLIVQDYERRRYSLQAHRYILACGGIENNRLLLWSDFLANGRLVEGRQTLGRYWFEHPHFTVGEAILAGQLGFDPGGPRMARRTYFFAPTDTAMRKWRILNCGIRVHGLRNGAERLIRDIACVAPSWAEWAYEQLRNGKLCTGLVRAAWEQEPRIENRITLGDPKDELGMPKVDLAWRKSELDHHTIQVMARAFGDYLAISKSGRLRIDDWLTSGGAYPSNDELAGNHHMGGTRMGVDASSAVVDKNGKVFGQQNLYVAGSSVFPSGGHANPTLTIVQLALRLSEHLREQQA
jgi:choline dehydrogenase-like flavoprotein